MKYVAVLALTVAFVGVLLLTYLIHTWYFPVDVIFYSALGDAVIAVVLTGLLSFAALRRLKLSGLERSLLVVVWLLLGYAFAISGPTVLDRSLSFYILEKLQQRGGGIRQDAIARVFVEEYLPEFRLVDVRLTEQLQSGTIEIVDGCVRLTPKGQAIARVSRFLRSTVLAKHRLLAGEYTDVLVNPYAGNTTGARGYECH